MKLKNKIKEVISMGVGRASFCWEPKPTGIFDTNEAIKTVDMITDMLIREIYEDKEFLIKENKDLHQEIGRCWDALGETVSNKMEHLSVHIEEKIEFLEKQATTKGG